MTQSFTPKKVALALSGGGRTLKNLIAQESGRAYTIAGVISSRIDCQGLLVAQDLGLPTYVGNFSSDQASILRSELQRWLSEQQIEWIALGGFLKPFPALPGFEQRIVNIHPALLPKYGGKGMYGMNVHRAVFQNRESYSGATIHFVNDHYDEGAIIAQIRVPVGGLDDPETIAAHIFSGECRLYPETLDRLCQGSLPLPNGAIFTLEG